MKTCPICLEKLEATNVTVTECGHLFHFKCIIKNIKLNPDNGFKCAICRRNFLPAIMPLKTYFNTANYSGIQYNPVAPIPTVGTQSIAYLSNMIEQRRRNNIENQQRQTNIIRSNMNRTIQRPMLSSNQRKINEIKKLSFSQLKNKMRELGISTRGYVRENLEKKIFEHLNIQGE